MAVQLILKNSSVEDKRPLASQLANGEISINYNEAGPFIACKDTAGNIQSLGGVKFGDDAPGDPIAGAWWFNTAATSLYVFDGALWQEVGGSGGGGGGISAIIGGEGIDANYSGTTVTLDVDLAEGDDGLELVAGRLKASTASKSQLGSVTVGDNVNVSTNGTISIPLATESTLGVVKVGDGIDVAVDGTISVDIPQTLNYRGSCLLANSPVGQINPSPPQLGDAYINGEATSAIDSGWVGLSGSASAGDLVVWDGTEWELISTGGTEYWTRDSVAEVLSPENDGDSVHVGLGNIQLNADGSGEFAGDVKIGGALPAAPNITLNAADGSASFSNGDVNIDSSGRLLVGTSSGFNFTTNSGAGISQQQLVGLGTDETASFAITHCNQGGTSRGPSLVLAKNRSGSTVLGTVQVDENLGEISFQGSTSSGFVRSAGIRCEQDGGTPSSTSMAGRLIFSTTAKGASSPKKRMQIDSSGDLLIGGALASSSPLAPNIWLKNNGEIIATADATINGVTVGRGNGNMAGNTASGTTCLNNNTTGNNNTAIGSSALSSNTEGSNNVAAGYRALGQNITGNNNIAVGRDALSLNIEGGNNVAVGRSSLIATTTGSNNVATGYFSLYSNETGVSNVAIGKDAGYYVGGSSNTILGSYKGTTADATLSDTIILAAGTAEKLRIDSTGSLLFGGTLPSAPAISLNEDGSAQFVGLVSTGVSSPIADRETTSSRQYSGFYVDQAADTTGIGVTTRFTSAADPIGARISLNRFIDSSTNVLDGDVLGEISSSGSQGGNVPRNSSKIRMVVDGTVGNLVPGAIEFMTATSALAPVVRARIDSSGSFALGGPLPSAPNITLNADGSANFNDYVQAKAGFRAKQDTDYYFIGQSTSNVNTFLVESSGNVKIGGTLPSVPNILLNATGSVTFNRDGAANSGVIGITNASEYTSITTIDGSHFIGENLTWGASNSTNLSKSNIALNADGSAKFTGLIDTALSINCSKVYLRDVNGNNANSLAIGATPTGGDPNGNVYIGTSLITTSTTYTLWTESDDPTKYTTTTDSEGNETRVYTGAVLDVKESITSAVAERTAMRETFQELLVAVQAATDFGQLKAAMLVALEDYA